MTRDQRLRRVALLCCHFLRNLAFYRAGWHRRVLRVRTPFWVNTNSNCLDVAVLEWCKLFAEGNGKHHWKRVVHEHAAFISGLCAGLRMSAKSFRKYAGSLSRYRNKFIAHLDEKNVMNIPAMRVARKSVAYLYEHLLRDPAAQRCLTDAPPSAKAFYAWCYRLAREQYRRAT